jgi:thiol:disulfide interchange protein DsbD
VSLTLPPGTIAGPIAWPTPVRLPEGPVMTYAYTGEVVLPMPVTPGPGELSIAASATWLVCEKICVPEEGTFTLALPQGTPSPSAEAPLFAATAARQPRPSPFAAELAPDGTLSLLGAGLSASTVRDAWFFPAEAGAINQAAAQPVQVEPGAVRIGLQPQAGLKPGTPLAGVAVLRDPGGQESALQISATPGPPVASRPGAGPGLPLWRTLLLAMAGGLILNLMPCVLPILAMKAVALARMSGKQRGVVRAHALFYTAGVLTAFAALALLLLALRAAGSAAGWGFQFQSPVFVAVTAWVLFLVGLNLSGVFQIGAGLAGVGQDLAARTGFAGSFFTGLLAVVVATPCTAPFIGGAVAAALASPPPAAVAVFLAMGVGLAAPYALLAAAPALARLLPRPGAWMEVLKSALAFPMYAAAAWLLWVISLQAGPDGVLAVAAGMVLLGFAAWAYGLAQVLARPSRRRLGYAAAAVAAALAVAVLPTIGNGAPAPAAAAAADGIEPFTPARLAALRAENRPVFVNMTAAWCVTCLVNEKLALSAAAVRQAFADRGVAYLKGDWTRGDPAISAFLRHHARDGVPLYVLYPTGHGEPVVLPQILTEAEMLAQLAKVSS